MRIEFILTAYVVYCGLAPVHSDKQASDKAVIGEASGEIGVQENFQHLFDSIARNNAEGGEIYREVLKDKVASAQQRFNAADEEVRIARNGNAYRNRFSSGKGDIVAVNKREANEPNLTCSVATRANCEENFVKHFGNVEYLPWSRALEWHKRDIRWKLNMVCNDAYKIKNPKLSYYIDEVWFFENITLVFNNPKYHPTLTDAIEFKSRRDERYNRPKASGDARPDVQNWILIQGRTDDCVTYVRSTDNVREVKLVEEVCGIEW